MKPKILVVEDDKNFFDALTSSLPDYHFKLARNLEEGKSKASDVFSLFLLDIRLGEKENVDGMTLLPDLRERFQDIPIVMMTAYGGINLAVEAMKKGATDFVLKAEPEHLESVIKKVIRQKLLKDEVNTLRVKVAKYEPWEIIGESKEILHLRELIKKPAEDGKITVLILGESGTGKELVARNIHRQGVRKDGPFVSESLKARESEGGTFESLIFGHEKGAFTGAISRRKGLFEQADAGILFLDEIGELDLSTQARLLRVLETRKFKRMGGTEEFESDVQLICATNIDLEKAVRDGKFRDDLYFRLNVFPIRTPRLSDNPEDIPLIIEHIRNRLFHEGRTSAKKISEEALKLLKAYSWPGNVRELSNCIERASMFSDEVIEPEHLPDPIQKVTSPLIFQEGERPRISIPKEGIIVDKILAKDELAYIEMALKMSDGKKGEAWELLGYKNRHNLRRRLKAHVRDFPEVMDDFPYLKKRYFQLVKP